MRSFQKNIILIMLSAVFMILINVCLASLLLNKNFWEVLRSTILAINFFSLLIFFGCFGLFGCGYVVKYGERYFWTFELNNNWPISQYHVLKTLRNFWIIMFLLGGVLYIFFDKEGLLQFLYSLIVFNIGSLFSLFILFIGSTLSFERTSRKSK